MKKLICIVFLISTAWTLRAQDKDLLIAETFLTANQFEKGKEAIDKYIAAKPANANNAEAIYYKAFAYNAVSREATKTLAEANSLNREAFNSIKRYRELDPKEKFTKEENNSTVFNVYYSFYDFAIKAYNAKSYDVSFNNFKDALEVHDYVFSSKLPGPKGINFSVMDTDVVWNLAILGNELKKTDEVFDYYKKIVDNNLKDPKFLEAYEAVVLHYQKANDQALFNQYLELGKTVFPKEIFWEEVDIQNTTQGAKGEALFKKYEDLTVKYPNSYTVWFYYGNDLNRFVYADENKAMNMTAYKAKVPDLLKKALAINSTGEANMLLANFYYNNSFDLSDASTKIKGTKPDDVKKRTELMNASKKSLDDCLPWAMAAVDIFSKQAKLRGTEKTNFRLAYDMLAEIYRVKGDPKKSAEFKAKKEAVL